MEQPSNTGDASGSASWDNSQESPPLPFPERNHDHEHFRHYPYDDRYGERFPAVNDGVSPENRDDPRSCLIVSVVFCSFVAITSIFGVYSPETLQLGPNTSVLINPNHLLVDSIKVVEPRAIEGSVLYGFYKTPSLDVAVTWSEIHETTLPVSTHKEWIYYFNEGSRINMSYNVSSFGSSSLVLIVAQGHEEFDKWLEDPLYSKATLSWKIIHGNGMIQMDVQKSSTYYIAVGNLNYEAVKVRLNTTVKAFLFNTTDPYYKCIPAQGECSFRFSVLGGNAAVLTSPCRKPGTIGSDCYVKLSYGPRWMTYLVGIGGITVLILVLNKFFNHSRHTEQATRRDQHGVTESERNPLLSTKEDDLVTSISSYVSDAENEDYVEPGETGSMAGEKPIQDGECRNSSQRVCAICFNAPRDCFFIPCGHCVTCFGCATRITETSGTCPICRQHVKKVGKIYSV